MPPKKEKAAAAGEGAAVKDARAPPKKEKKATAAKRPPTKDDNGPPPVVERLTHKLAEHFPGLAGRVYTEDGVWRTLTVDYTARDEDPCAIFKDKRCEHIHKLYLNDINEHIVNAIAHLPDLCELHVRKLGAVFYDAGERLRGGDEVVVDYAPSADLWPQLRSLTVASCKARCDAGDKQGAEAGDGDKHYVHRVGDKLVYALASAAPNLRRLHIDWTYRLDCLGQLLESLPALEELTLHYAVAENYEHESVPITSCKPLDKVTPAALQAMVLVERCRPPLPIQLWDEESECPHHREVSLVRLAAALVRMQHRAPQRFTIELCGKRL